MHYIILDLEWNQPVSFQSEVYRKMGDKLLFEVIQIGAVKMDESLNIVDSISIPVCPSFYTRIHPRIKRITGLSQEVLCDADTFPQAMEKFMDWCGEDAIFITWGGDDISVLAQNIACFQMDIPVPPMYDLQKRYGKARGKGGQVALKAALEDLGIQPEEERSFHNAVHDAYYTGLIFAKLENPEKILEHVEHVKTIRHSDKTSRLRITHKYDSVKEALASETLLAPQCPNCRQMMKLQTSVIPQTPGRYIALAKCPVHGNMLVKVRFMQLQDEKVGMNLSIVPANAQSKAYTRTKEYQYQFKKKRGDYDHFDPEDLSRAGISSMPFEDLRFDKKG